MPNFSDEDRTVVVTLACATVGAGTAATLLRKLALGRIHPFQFEAISGTTHAVVGWLCLSYALTRGIGAPSMGGASLAIVQSIFNCLTGITFMFLIRAGAPVGSSSAITSSAITASTILASRLLFDEVITPRMAIGAAVMMVGIAIATLR